MTSFIPLFVDMSLFGSLIAIANACKVHYLRCIICQELIDQDGQPVTFLCSYMWGWLRCIMCQGLIDWDGQPATFLYSYMWGWLRCIMCQGLIDWDCTRCHRRPTFLCTAYTVASGYAIRTLYTMSSSNCCPPCRCKFLSSKCLSRNGWTALGYRPDEALANMWMSTKDTVRLNRPNLALHIK